MNQLDGLFHSRHAHKVGLSIDSLQGDLLLLILRKIISLWGPKKGTPLPHKGALVHHRGNHHLGALLDHGAAVHKVFNYFLYVRYFVYKN